MRRRGMQGTGMRGRGCRGGGCGGGGCRGGDAGAGDAGDAVVRRVGTCLKIDKRRHMLVTVHYSASKIRSSLRSVDVNHLRSIQNMPETVGLAYLYGVAALCD